MSSIAGARVGLAGLLGGLSMLLVAGCSGGAEGAANRHGTAQVTGTVTYNGQPVEGASVTFSPNVPVAEAGTAKAAFGRTDASGKFTLRTYEPDDGAIPGEYRVAISKFDQPLPALPEGYDEERDYEPPDENAPPPPPAKSLIPERYSNPGTSGFVQTVEEGTENHFEFKLAD
jgi:hypothetical protein